MTAMDPPGMLAPQSPGLLPPQPFEIALVRKLDSKTSSVRNAFLLLDIDGDGRISPYDVRTVLHNELGVDITDEQMDTLFTRSSNGKPAKAGMGYADFARYYEEVSNTSYPTSQSGLAAAVGFERDEGGKYTANGDGGLDREMSIHLQERTVVHQRRHQLRQILTAHSSRESQGNCGMKATGLFLAMDVHRSGKVTMQEFLDWVNSVGMLEWTMGDLRQVVILGDDEEDEVSRIDREQLFEKRWFGSSDGREGETGMTEQDFAEFIETLDDE